MRFKAFMISGAALLVSVPTLSSAAQLDYTSQPCAGVTFEKYTDGTWTVNDNGSISSWGAGYTFEDLYSTFCSN